ncbi:MAG: hypothetical protein ACOVS5_04540 [Oligoflexus sp.]|jgi:uncharacterized membrane protein
MFHSPSIVRGICASVIFLSPAAFAEDTAPVTSPTYADIAPVVEGNCVGCHNSEFAYADIVLETEGDLLKHRDSVESAITSGFMPLGVPEFKDSEEGKALLAWLAAQKPVAPSPAQ